MNALLDLVHKGGLPLIAIAALSVALYSRCCKLLLTLAWMRRQPAYSVPQEASGSDDRRQTVQRAFEQQRLSIRAMIAAAPLLGLLGTVSGMAKTFDSLGHRAGEKSMEGLARGISEVLVATEAGLAVALPAMALLFLAHREVQRTAARRNLASRSRPSTP